MNSKLIKNITIIDPSQDEPLDNRSILVKNGKIVAIDKATCIDIDDGCEIIDGEENFILPGFIDMHVHLMANGFLFEDAMNNPLAIHFYKALKNMKDTIDAGVTYVRDCGLADIGVKLAQKKGMFLAPKMKISVMPLSISRGHFDFKLNSGFDMVMNYPGLPHPVCNGVEGVITKTREVLGSKADFIKVMTTGGVVSINDSPEFTQFNRRELKAIVSEAKMRGNTKVSAHAHGSGGIENAVKAGIHFIEHGTYINKKIAKLMADEGTYLVPTRLVISETKKNAEKGKLKKDLSKKAMEVSKFHKENMGMAYNEGVKMLMGTDSGVIEHGQNLKELKLLCEIGMEPMEAITSGTIEAAKSMEIDNEVGSIAIGKSADMIMTDKNPLDDISYLGDSNNILMVFQDGKIVKNRFN
ncbi:MAG: amidohydrolase family protein [Methanobacteriaceae archaeon]|jgi:imidazolonepropionase-like amidohydrolase|nr:amidohydrolase family protein [Candidatus Methanorudis spinitermitis]